MKEIPIKLLLKTITGKRLLNAVQALSGYTLSMLTRKPRVWGRPFILTVEPTNACNLRCPLCVTGNGKMRRSAGMMDFDTFKRVIDDSAETLFYLLLYQQGEPFLNRSFVRFIEYAKRKRIFVTTSTNGHYFDEATARQTVSSGLDSMIVSIDGASQESYEKYRVGGDLEKVKAGIRNLVQEKARLKMQTPVIFVQFIVMQHNESEITDMKRLVEELGVDKLLIKSVQVETTVEGRKWLPANPAWRRYETADNATQLKKRRPGPCPRPWTSSLINWDGSVVPCCFDKHGEFKTGAIDQDGSFEQTWSSEQYAEFRHKMLNNRDALAICANCTQGLPIYF